MNSTENGEISRKFKGISVNSGKVRGAVCLYSAEWHKAVPEYSLPNEHAVELELKRLEETLAYCSAELDEIAEKVKQSMGRTESEIFVTQKHIMNDPKVIQSVISLVSGQKRNLESAISEVLGSYEERFASLDNQYLRERSSDIGEIRRRLLTRLINEKTGVLCKGQSKCLYGENRIIVAEELTADMIVSLNIDKVLGLITEHGGITSHAAIIARSLGIPAVTGIQGIMEIIKCGDEVLIDGDKGELYLNPEINLVHELIPVEQGNIGDVCILGTPPGMSALANASSLDDTRLAWAVGADGIGLFRTEILFMREDKLPDEDEQYHLYSQVCSIMQGKPITFRLLDIGGDKPLPFIKMKKEANPYLGWRGARFLLGNQEIFRAQIRALGRLSLDWKVKILFPMVIDVAQWIELKKSAIEAIRSLQSFNMDNIELGAMFEVPSAFLQADEIFKLIDFGSVGSNDLIQYLFAIDRTNELVSQDYNPEHPVLWKLLSSLSAAASVHGKPLSICGELAGREGYPTRLLDSGITSLSVTPRLIPRVRNEMARYAGILV
ncbi:MAG TPA: phosphoenolpyruvate--protein phosphotransferase [Chitinispirillaceae bacterium]|nr:phosphoenolpyruvate--protein phosphotransferase [Chitinispirillaceae bacterium]